MALKTASISGLRRLLAKTNGKNIERPAGIDTDKFAKVRKVLERIMSAAETAVLFGIHTVHLLKEPQRKFYKP